MLDGSEHQITNVLAADAACGSEETHGLAITAIEREGDRARAATIQSRPKSHNASSRSTSTITCMPASAPPSWLRFRHHLNEARKSFFTPIAASQYAAIA